MTHRSLACLLGAFIPLSAAQAMSTEECQVFDRERAFAASLAAHDADAFAGFLHPNTVFNMVAAEELRGQQAVLKAWGGLLSDGPTTLDWHPQWVHIGGDGDIATSTGPFVMTRTAEDGSVSHQLGRFLTVWQRSKDGQWYVVFDGSAMPPQPTDADGAEAHMRVPEDCVPEQSAAQP